MREQEICPYGYGHEAAAAMLSYGFTLLSLPRIVAAANPKNIASEKRSSFSAAAGRAVFIQSAVPIASLDVLIYSLISMVYYFSVNDYSTKRPPPKNIR